MTKKYTHLFFDLDDTLWDFHTNARSALLLMFQQENLSTYYPDFDTFYQLYSKRNIELWSLYGQGKITKDYLVAERFLYPLQQVGIRNRALAVKMNSNFLELLVEQTALKPFAKELLEYGKKNGYSMTIVSNGFQEVQHKKMKGAGIHCYFDHIVLSETAGALKPNPLIFEYALTLNNAQKEHTLMIGDSFDADIIGASAYGIDTLFLNNRNQSVNLPPNVKEIKKLEQVLHFI